MLLWLTIQKSFLTRFLKVVLLFGYISRFSWIETRFFTIFVMYFTIVTVVFTTSCYVYWCNLWYNLLMLHTNCNTRLYRYVLRFSGMSICKTVKLLRIRTDLLWPALTCTDLHWPALTCTDLTCRDTNARQNEGHAKKFRRFSNRLRCKSI
jgi:hypothetical protein